MVDTIVILDFGSQYTQLIARRVRELHVYCELFPWDADPPSASWPSSQGYHPLRRATSVYDPARQPCLPMCSSRAAGAGHLLRDAAAHPCPGRAGGLSAQREYGPAEIRTVHPNPLLLPGSQPVWMSHGDRIEQLPPGFHAAGAQRQQPLCRHGQRERRRSMGCSSTPKCTTPPAARKFCAALCSRSAQRRRNGPPSRSSPQAWSASARRWASSACLRRSAAGSIPAWRPRWCTAPSATSSPRSLSIPACCARTSASRWKHAFRQNLGVQLIAVDAIEDFLTRLQGVTEPEAQAQDHRRDLHPHL